jgi:cytochrome oxidase assembly protein ShyY1
MNATHRAQNAQSPSQIKKSVVCIVTDRTIVALISHDAHRYDDFVKYRFLYRPSWVFLHVTVVAAIVLMINLGLWQYSRYGERIDFNKIVSARIDAQPKQLQSLLTELGTDGIEASDLEWLNVSVSGTYLDDQTLLAVNRSQEGISGVDPLTPFLIGGSSIDGDSGDQVVLVNRGFITQTTATPKAPDGPVQLIARVRVSESRRFGELSDPTTGKLSEVINIDLPRLSQQIKNLNTEIYLEVLDSQPKDSPTIARIADPVLSTGSHLSYTAQWFIFSIFVAAGWVVVVRRKLKSG